MNLLVLDVGTTHTRAFVVLGGRVVSAELVEVGACDTAVSGSKVILTQGLQQVVNRTLQRAGLRAKQLEAVFAVGMATSELGLVDVPHCTLPAGAPDIADAVVTRSFPEVVSQPINFIPGAKSVPERLTLENLHCADFMRAEETQAIGLLEIRQVLLPTNVVFLTSHTKVVAMDKQARITGSLTTMSGQVLRAILRETFLAESVLKEGWEEFVPDEECLQIGARIAKDWGILRALMLPRLMDILMDTTVEQRSSVLEGAIIGADVQALHRAGELEIDLSLGMVLVGTHARCKAFEHLCIEQQLCKQGEITILSGTQEIRQMLISGVLRIARHCFPSTKKVS